jgi:hypothetical protein
LTSGDHWQHFNLRVKPFIADLDTPVINTLSEKSITAGCYDFYFTHSYLVDKLLGYIREKCTNIDEQKIHKQRLFYESLKDEFDIGFINLNYDNVILQTLPDLDTGFDREIGKFERTRLWQNKWNFCYHIHGSVHFDMGGDGYDLHKIFWEENIKAKFSNNISSRGSDYSTSGIRQPHSSIICGLDKANQVLKEPFSLYFKELDRLIYHSDAILFVGYGFNDIHLNKAFPFIRRDNSKTRKVCIIDWKNDTDSALKFDSSTWANGIFSAIPVNAREMGPENGQLYATPGFYKSNRLMEVSKNNNYPLSVWYSGLSAAWNYPEKFIKALR